jgi:DNA-binding IclR family transcriptional regulator
MNEDRDLVVALARGLEILGAFSAQTTHLTVTELAERTGLPKATVARLTYTLAELSFLRRVPGKRSYTLGAAVLALGYPMLASLTIRQIAEPFMRELSDYAQANVSLAMLDRDRLVYVETCRWAASTAEHRPDIGLIWPLDGAIGRSFLVGMPENERKPLLNVLKVQEPERWDSRAAKIDAALDEYERVGFCTASGEVLPAFYGVAVPIKKPINGNRFAFNCAPQATPQAMDRITNDLGPRLVKMVASIEAALGALNRIERTNPVRRNFTRQGRPTLPQN